MTTKKSAPSAKPAKLSVADDEASLWQFVASSIAPLKKPKGRVHTSAPGDLPAAQRTPAKPAEPPPGAKVASAKPSKPVPIAPAAPRPPSAPPQLADFDRKKARKIRMGQIEIEARIDLHGMRQTEAHASLRAFLMSCYRREQRWVLVITGKGGPRNSSGDDDLDDFMGGHQRGVLRQNVPRWLGEPDLRALVVSYTTAAIRHGGEGALYIHLRSPHR